MSIIIIIIIIIINTRFLAGASQGGCPHNPHILGTPDSRFSFEIYTWIYYIASRQA